MEFRRAAGIAARFGAILIDVDEVSNRIRVGVPNATAETNVYQALIEAGIPENAVLLVKEEPSANDTCTSADDIRNRCRPGAGGLKISTPVDTAFCTLGFVVQFNSRNGFLTAAHCTPFIYSIDTTYFAFQNVIDVSNPLGFEYAELHGFKVDDESSPCYYSGWYQCRTADAAFFVTSGSGATTDFSRIYLPADSMFGFTFNSNDVWEITSDGSEPAYGTVVIKVGQKKGRVQAPVSHTCTDMAQGGAIWSLCQTRATHPTQTIEQAGDSGAPVFVVTGSGALKVYGMVWGGGGTAGSTHFNFANTSGIYWGFNWDYSQTPVFY